MSNEAEQTDERDLRGETGDLGVALRVRRPACGPRTTVTDRLSALRTAGALAGFDVTTWPEEIALTGDERRTELLETVKRFEA